MSTAAEPVHARAEPGRVESSRAEDRMEGPRKKLLFSKFRIPIFLTKLRWINKGIDD